MEHKSQQIAVCNSHISDLNKEVEALSSSLQEKEATVAQLEGELHSYQKADTNLKLLSDILTLTTEIAELRQTLQEAEYQKQQSSLEKDVAVQEVEAKKKVEMQLHRHLGKVVVKKKLFIHTHIMHYTAKPHRFFQYLQMNLPRSLITPKALRMLSYMNL